MSSLSFNFSFEKEFFILHVEVWIIRAASITELGPTQLHWPVDVSFLMHFSRIIRFICGSLWFNCLLCRVRETKLSSTLTTSLCTWTGSKDMHCLDNCLNLSSINPLYFIYRIVVIIIAERWRMLLSLVVKLWRTWNIKTGDDNHKKKSELTYMNDNVLCYLRKLG